jgi:hypothetical protein
MMRHGFSMRHAMRHGGKLLEIQQLAKPKKQTMTL